MTSSMRSAIVPKWKTKTNLINKGIFAIHAKKLVTVTLHKPIITLSKFQNATYRIRPAVLLLVIVRSKKKWPEQIGNFRSHMQYSL